MKCNLRIVFEFSQTKRKKGIRNDRTEGLKSQDFARPNLGFSGYVAGDIVFEKFYFSISM